MRARICQILEPGRVDDKTGRWFDIFIVSLITLNIIAIIFGSVASIYNRFADYFDLFELFSVAVFSIEYVLRLWSIVDYESGKYAAPVKGRLAFSLTPLAIVDLLAILPFYLGMFFNLDLRFLRALRLLRIFKLTRYSTAMSLLLKVLRDEMQAFAAAFFILLVILILASSGIYLFEHKSQPEAFSSIPQSIWWAVSTLTTVGYGDVTPVTVGGKIFGAVIMVLGIGMVALPAGILASAFSEQVHLRRREYEVLAKEALRDGQVSRQEHRELAAARAELGLNEEDAEKILAQISMEETQQKSICPHCGKVLNQPDS